MKIFLVKDLFFFFSVNKDGAQTEKELSVCLKSPQIKGQG